MRARQWRKAGTDAEEKIYCHPDRPTSMAVGEAARSWAGRLKF